LKFKLDENPDVCKLIKNAVREVIQDELGKAWLEGLSTISEDARI
jgi:hypothetical protein